MEIVKEFQADRFTSLALWFHFCNTYQLEICPRCQRSARQCQSSPVPSWSWTCSSCSSETNHRPAPTVAPESMRADAVGVKASIHHGVGSTSPLTFEAKLAFPKFKNRVA